jgi:AmiR/NasT family two-component response regulator
MAVAGQALRRRVGGERVINASDQDDSDAEMTVEQLRTLVAQLRDGMAGRDTIGMAKGLLMAAQKITDEAAFEAIRHASQRQNRRVRDVAADLVAEHNRRLGV